MTVNSLITLLQSFPPELTVLFEGEALSHEIVRGFDTLHLKADRSKPQEDPIPLPNAYLRGKAPGKAYLAPYGPGIKRGKGDIANRGKIGTDCPVCKEERSVIEDRCSNCGIRTTTENLNKNE